MKTNIKLEEACLGAIICNDGFWIEVEGILSASCFDYAPCKEIYKAIVDISKRGQSIDAISVTREVYKSPVIQKHGGASYVSGLMISANEVYSSIKLRELAFMLRDDMKLRSVLQASIQVQQMIVEGLMFDEVFDFLSSKISALDNDKIKSGPNPLHVIMKESVQELYDRHRAHKEGRNICVPTGINSIDNATGGLWPGQLIVMAGRPGMGKTSVLLNMAINAAKNNIPACIYSLEMPAVRLVDRLLVRESDVNSHAFRRGTVNSDDFSKVEKAFGDMYNLPLYIDDGANISMKSIINHSTRLHRKGQCNAIFIDYAQLIEDDSKFGNRAEEVAKITRSAKKLATSLKVPVVLLSQLNRDLEKRDNKRPMLSDLRESGSLEQDADVVLLLLRPEYYEKQKGSLGKTTWTIGPDEYDIKGLLEIIIPKQREGVIGSVFARFNANMSKLEDLEQPKNII